MSKPSISICYEVEVDNSGAHPIITLDPSRLSFDAEGLPGPVAHFIQEEIDNYLGLYKAEGDEE